MPVAERIKKIQHCIGKLAWLAQSYGTDNFSSLDFTWYLMVIQNNCERLAKEIE